MSSWRDNLIKTEPYVAGEQPKGGKFIKLNANENPYPPSPMVEKAIAGFRAAGLNKYPDANVAPLCEALAKRAGVDTDNVFAGNGSDEVLALAFRAFFNSELPVLFADVTYSFYPVWCENMGIRYECIPLDDAFNYKAEDYARPNGGVVICNPNAPTTIGRDLDFIRSVLDANRDSVVIVDEAYVDFGGVSSLPLLSEYDNLLVVQTFSKSRSMAGMRIGCAFGSKELIAALRAAKDSYNSYPLDSVAIAAGIASVSDESYFADTVGKITATRDRLTGALRDMGAELPDSSTNFVFARFPGHSAVDIYNALKTKGIYVRYFNKPRIDDRLRITIGTDEETDMLIENLRRILGNNC